MKTEHPHDVAHLEEKPVHPSIDSTHRTSTAPASPARPRIFVGEDVWVSRLRLSQVLRGAGYEVSVQADDLSLADAVRREPQAPALFLLSISASDPSSVDAICYLETQGLTGGAPILCVTAIEDGAVDFEMLRLAGVSGVVDPRWKSEDLVLRINRLLRPPQERRRHLRANAAIPVALTADGQTTDAVITSISVGGIGIVSGRNVGVNTDVHVRFALTEPPHEVVEAHGRVIHAREAAGRWTFGMFFYPLSDRATRFLHEEVERLLSLE
jgi:CheY-like chemotaxis protein